MYKIVSKKSLNPTVTQMEIYAPFVAKKALQRMRMQGTINVLLTNEVVS